MTMPGNSNDEQSIGLLLVMVFLAVGLLVGLMSSAGAVKGAIGLGVLSTGLLLFSIPAVKPGMEDMMQVSLQIGFYGILVCSILGVALHVLRLKDST